MENLLRFAIIGVSSLEAIALRRILADELGVNADFFPGFKELEPAAEKYDAFIAVPYVLLSNIDFFMPRKQKTVAIVDKVGEERSPFMMISRDSTELDIVDSLRKVAESVKFDTTPQGDLSQRELDVLREVAKGKTNKEIADTLCISINTVITHRRNVSLKLGIRSASGLSLYALMNGLI